MRLLGISSVSYLSFIHVFSLDPTKTLGSRYYDPYLHGKKHAELTNSVPQVPQMAVILIMTSNI